MPAVDTERRGPCGSRSTTCGQGTSTCTSSTGPFACGAQSPAGHARGLLPWRTSLATRRSSFGRSGGPSRPWSPRAPCATPGWPTSASDVWRNSSRRPTSPSDRRWCRRRPRERALNFATAAAAAAAAAAATASALTLRTLPHPLPRPGPAGGAAPVQPDEGPPCALRVARHRGGRVLVGLQLALN